MKLIVCENINQLHWHSLCALIDFLTTLQVSEVTGISGSTVSEGLDLGVASAI